MKPFPQYSYFGEINAKLAVTRFRGIVFLAHGRGVGDGRACTEIPLHIISYVFQSKIIFQEPFCLITIQRNYLTKSLTYAKTLGLQRNSTLIHLLSDPDRSLEPLGEMTCQQQGRTPKPIAVSGSCTAKWQNRYILVCIVAGIKNENCKANKLTQRSAKSPPGKTNW